MTEYKKTNHSDCRKTRSVYKIGDESEMKDNPECEI